MAQHPNTSEEHDGNTHSQSNANLNSDQLLDVIFQALQKQWLQGRRIASYVAGELAKNAYIDAAIVWCMEHPDIAICVLLASLLFCLPFLIILMFGLVAMAITLTGILVLEGTLLSVILMISFVCIASWVFGVTIFGIVAYFGFTQICDLLGLGHYREAFLKFVQQNRRDSSEPAQNENY